MAKAKGSVRIGPISIFTLIILLCLAVLSVLAVATAHATYASAEKQARFTSDTYANEQAAQMFVSSLDASLGGVRESAATPEEALEQINEMQDYSMGAPPNDSWVEGTTLYATFSQESGRTLTIGITIREDLTYEIAQWKATTEWKEDTDIGNLWPGSSS